MNWKNWKIKVLKLSTYNSLNNQLKLKDTIISLKDVELNELKQSTKKHDITIREQLKEIEILNEENHVLTERNKTQAISIHQIHNDRAAILEDFARYKGKRDAKGQFIRKEVVTEKVIVNEEV